MTSMMNIKSMTSMKYMKWMVYFRTYIECKYYVVIRLLIPCIIIIFGYSPTEDYCSDSTVIAT